MNVSEAMDTSERTVATPSRVERRLRQPLLTPVAATAAVMGLLFTLYLAFDLPASPGALLLVCGAGLLTAAVAPDAEVVEVAPDDRAAS